MGGALLINWPPIELNLAQQYSLTDPVLRGSYRSVLRLRAGNKDYALKCVQTPPERLAFLLEIQQFLEARGFTWFPRLIPTVHGQYFVPTTRGTYFLMEWIHGMESNYTNYSDLKICASTLGRLHRLSQGFAPAVENLPKVWGEKFAGLADMEQSLTSLPGSLQRLFPQIIKAGREAMNLLSHAQVLESARKPLVVCHHDLTHRNFIISPAREGYLIDFDYAVADSPMRDLAQFLSKVLKRHEWDVDLALFLLSWYAEDSNLTHGDLGLLLAYLYFPRTLRELNRRISTTGSNPQALAKAINSAQTHVDILPFLDKLQSQLGY